MKVLMRANLIIDGVRYRASLDGTEIPDFTKDGRKIVLHDPGGRRPKASLDEEGKIILPEVHMLPKDVKPFTEEAAKEERKQKLPLHAKAQTSAETFSEITRGSKVGQKRTNVDL